MGTNMNTEMKVEMNTEMKTDMNEMKAEDCKSKLVVVARAELDLLRDTLEQVIDACWECVTIKELRKLENASHRLEHLMSREKLQLQCFQAGANSDAAEDL
jgi:hypothetical protein